jgi:hypothetical protein
MRREVIQVEPPSTYLERWKAPAVTRRGDTIYVSSFLPCDPKTGEVVAAPVERRALLRRTWNARGGAGRDRRRPAVGAPLSAPPRGRAAPKRLAHSSCESRSSTSGADAMLCYP